MITINRLDSLERAVQKYNLRVVEKADNGGFREYRLARAGSGSRGGRFQNYRIVILSPTQDCEAHRLNLLKR